MTLPAADIEVLLPERGEQITFVNVKKLATSPLFKTMLQKEIEERLKATEVPKWLKEMGIDMWKDIDTFSLAVTTLREDGKRQRGKPPMVFMVVRGTFQGGKVFDAAEKAVSQFGDKLSIVKDGDVKMLRIEMSKDFAMHATMADEKTIVIASDKEDLLHSLKVADDPNAKPKIKKELQALIETLDKNAAFYQAMMLDSAEIAADLQPNPLIEDIEVVRKQVEEITCYSMVARIGKDVAFELGTGWKSPEAAAAFGETAKGMVDKGKTLLPLLATQSKEMAGVVNDLKKSLKVTVVKDTVVLSLKVSGSAIGQVFGIEE
jgi:hypothetical protein